MKATVYVNFKTDEIVGEKEFNRMLGELVDELMKPQRLNEYLECRGFSYSDIFYMKPEDKSNILVNFEYHCASNAKAKLGFVKREVEV